MLRLCLSLSTYANYDTSSALVPKILRTTFNGIKSSADIKLGERVRDVVVTLPDHVDHEIQEAVMRAAGLVGYEVLGEIMGFTEAVGWAYGVLVGGESNGRGGEVDGDGDGKGVSVVVEYNESELDIWIMNDAWVPQPKGHMIFPELGVEAIPSPSADDTSTYLLTVQRRLDSTLRKFLV